MSHHKHNRALRVFSGCFVSSGTTNQVLRAALLFFWIFASASFTACAVDPFEGSDSSDTGQSTENEALGNGPNAISAVRYENEGFEEASQRANSVANNPFLAGSALNVAVALDQIDFSKLADWADDSEILTAFEKGRDERFLQWYYWFTSFPRRLSWLYPDDGCHLRADYLRTNFAAWGYPPTMKLFVFGKLKVNTKNHPKGSVSWWFHVVPIAAHQGTPVVFDAAIDPSRPMTVEEWAKSMAEEAGVDTFKYSLCHPEAFIPFNQCDNPKWLPSMGVKNFLMSSFLNKEWQRLRELGRNPQEELGDNPPW